jgi:hypothetical protein
MRTSGDDLQYWLDQLLQAGDDDRAYTVAEEALLDLGRLDPGHFRQAVMARRESVSPDDQVVLAGLVVAVANGPEVAPWLESLWDQVSGPDRALLAQVLAQTGDTRFVPLLQGALISGQLDRVEFINARHALEALGGEVPAAAVAPPSEDTPAYVVRVERAEASKAVGALREANYHAMEAEAILRREMTRDPRAVGMVQFESLLRRIDGVLERKKAPIKRFLDYCHGALVYLGVAPVDLLVKWVAEGTMLPDAPAVDEIWAAAQEDPRFRVVTDRMLALPEVVDVDWVLAQRRELQLTNPPYPDFETVGLAGIGRAHLAWLDEEKAAATAVLNMLAEPWALPEHVAQLQSEMRADKETGMAVLKRWLPRVKPGNKKRFPHAFSELWNTTARWELFGYAPLDFGRPAEEAPQPPKGKRKK